VLVLLMFWGIWQVLEGLALIGWGLLALVQQLIAAVKEHR
jgi:hypothetical protein